MPREGIVTDVGEDFLTLGVGNSWPVQVSSIMRVSLARALTPILH